MITIGKGYHQNHNKVKSVGRGTLLIFLMTGGSRVSPSRILEKEDYY